MCVFYHQDKLNRHAFIETHLRCVESGFLKASVIDDVTFNKNIDICLSEKIRQDFLSLMWFLAPIGDNHEVDVNQLTRPNDSQELSNWLYAIEKLNSYSISNSIDYGFDEDIERVDIYEFSKAVLTLEFTTEDLNKRKIKTTYKNNLITKVREACLSFFDQDSHAYLSDECLLYKKEDGNWKIFGMKFYEFG